jgi:hypothetical protein
MHNKVYYATFERDGWFEYHCSTNKLEVEKCQALSVKAKLASPYGLPSFVRVVLIQQLTERIRQEVQTNRMVRVMVDADKNVSLEI